MYDLIVAALQTDSTRVATFRQPIQYLLTSLGLKVASHDMSHYQPGGRMEASQKRDLAQGELLASLRWDHPLRAAVGHRFTRDE